METGRVIQRRYLLQRVVKQGQVCIVYQGFDQVLQRAVAVKAAPAEHVAVYRAAMRSTSQFAHPHIIGIYDLIIEPETLYIVQEYVDGDDFGTLLQTQLTPYQVADLGAQICRALIYTGSPSRKICHGDLTPSSVIYDRRGLVRLNNFALPSDLNYFTSWSIIGGEGRSVSDQNLPWGQLSEGRRADDTRAVGILLYQALTGRTPGATSVEPPADGRLRFQRSVPPELCNLVARTVISQHPQHITTADVLYAELKAMAEALEPPVVVTTATPQLAEDAVRLNPFAPMTGQLATPSLARESVQTGQTGLGISAYRQETSAPMASMELPAASPLAPGSPTVADIPVKLATARQAAYPQRVTETAAPAARRLNLPVLLGLGLLLFAIFFVVGYFLAQSVLR